jgi:signal peptidase
MSTVLTHGSGIDDPSSAPEPPSGSTRRRIPARDIAVTIVGTIGMLAVVWLLVSWLFSLSVTVFITGSMSPTMPTGTGAIVQSVSAAELQVGDVVTVHRPDTGTPVTHRIVAIDDVEGSPESRALTLKGDDNAYPDRDTYVVDEVGRVVASLPGVGTVIIWLKHPIAMGAIAVIVAAIAAWALWPSRQGRAAPRH